MPRAAQEIEASVLRGRLSAIRYHKDGFLVGTLAVGEDSTSPTLETVKGEMLQPVIGLVYVLHGSRTVHPRFGEQFAFTAYEAELPTGRDAIRAYLQEVGDYVGPVVAKAIVEAYGDEAIEVCRQAPERVAAEIRGMTPDRARALAKTLRDSESEEKWNLQMKELLAGTRISKSAIRRIRDLWGAEAPAIISANPFLLTEVSGIGFPSADSVASRVGIAHDAPVRIRAGLVYVLEEAAREGHSCLPAAVLIRRATELLVLSSKDTVDAETSRLEDEGGLVYSPDADLYYLPGLYDAEESVRKDLLAHVSREIEEDVDPVLDGLKGDQVEAVSRAVRERVFYLVGAPGTGKTFAVRRIVDSFPGARIALAAPTGKAARRLSESTGLEATTIHRLLGTVVKANGSMEFVAGRTNPIKADVVVIDEASMLDVRLAASLFEAVSPATRLYIVGDPNQLPSVGPGTVLADIVASGAIPGAELREIKRQDPGLIVTNCHRIRDGKGLLLDNSASRDLFFLERGSPETIAREIVELVTTRLPKAYKASAIAGDIQVLSALREKTLLGCESLNDRLQEALNRDGETVPGEKLRAGDRVIQLANITARDEIAREEVFVANGDLGRVIAIEAEKIEVQFENPGRRIVFSRRGHNLGLAYALTVHKFQGSEARIVVIPVDRCYGPLVFQRNWIYTALSRAREVCILVGDRNEAEAAIGRVRAQARYGDLRRKLSNDSGREDDSLLEKIEENA